MAVYTEVTEKEAAAMLKQLKLGELTYMKGCSGGIENTNYFVSTALDGQTNDYVLTLFERLSFEQLPFYLRLMKHLAGHGIPVPDPTANAKGELVLALKDKPTSVVSKLHGASELNPTAEHCAAVGATLAKMHLAGRDFELSQPNLRGLSWWNDTAPVVLPYLTRDQAQLMQSELAYQNHVAQSSAYTVMFDTVDGKPQLTGFFDFYFAGVDAWLFDIAVTLNDWCIDLATGTHHAERAQNFMAAYGTVRPLTASERELLPAMLRAGALRFWLSRLWDLHLPREASMLKAHDPSHFERVLRARISPALSLSAMALPA